jgi:predicted  nucleic acid-binding Zn-ribbon protein
VKGGKEKMDTIYNVVKEGEQYKLVTKVEKMVDEKGLKAEYDALKIAIANVQSRLATIDDEYNKNKQILQDELSRLTSAKEVLDGIMKEIK